MPKFRLNKLVRDRILEHQIKAGSKTEYRLLEKLEHRSALVNKLIEEGNEILSVGEKEVASEIADVQQALDDLIEQFGLTKEDIKAHQRRKLEANGGFKRGIFIDTVETLDEDPLTEYYRSQPERFEEITD